MSVAKAEATDGPKRAVLSGTRKRTPVRERHPCHPVGPAALQPGFVAGGGEGEGEGEPPRRVPGLRVACC